MPCATVHLDAADRVLKRWDGSAAPRAPFDSSDPDLRDLFLQGALGPDMGYVPGVHRLISDLAHYVRSSDLARALVNRANTPEAVAYAWGWVTHCLTDILVHPLVGRACGELLYGSRDLRLNSGAHIGTHVAVEVGLDAEVLNREGARLRAPRRALLGTAGSEALRDALGTVYGLEWDPKFLRRSHRTATYMNWRWPRALRWVTGPGWSGSEPGSSRVSSPLSGRLAGVFMGLAGRIPDVDSSARGLLNPIRPTAWLLDEVARVSESFPERFQALVDGGLDGLVNHNLENGIPETSGVQHPFALTTRLQLGDLVGGRSSAPGLAFTALGPTA